MSRMNTTVVMAKIARVTAVTVTLAVGLAAPGRAEAQSGAGSRNENTIACAQAFENPQPLSGHLCVCGTTRFRRVVRAIRSPRRWY